MKSMLEEMEQMEHLEDFFAEEPTGRCGEGGCNHCHTAFKMSCEPIIVPPMDGVVHVEEAWEGDTDLDIRTVFVDDVEYAELGGEG